MKERTKRLCDSIIALSLAVSVLSSAAAIKTYSARLDTARPGVTAFAASYTENPTTMPGYNAGDGESGPTVTIYYKIGADGESVSKVIATGEEAVNALAANYTVQITSLSLPAQEAAEGKEFAGWALTAEKAAAGETDTQFTDENLFNTTVILYAVFVDKASEESSEGEQEQGTGDGTEDNGEEEQGTDESETQGLTDEQKTALTNATTAFNKVKSDAETVRTNAGKADADKEALQTQLETLESTLATNKATLDGIPEELQTDAAYTVAKKAYDAADDMLNSAKYTVGQLLSAADKVRIEQIKQYLADATTLANEAKEAADAKDAALYNQKKEAASAKENDAINTVEAAENPDAVSEATQADYDKYARAVSTAVASYNRNIAIAKDASGKEYTGSQIYADVTEIDQTEKGKAAAAFMKTEDADYTNDDNHYLRVFDVALKTVSGDKPVTLNAGQSYAVTELGGSDLDKRVKTCKIYYVNDANTAKEEVDDFEWREEINKRGYYTFYVNFVNQKFGTFAVTGNSYAKSNAVVENDSGEYEQKDVTSDNNNNTNNIISVNIVTDNATKKKEAIQSLSDAERARVIAVYQIYLKNNGHVVEGQQVEVSVKDPALKAKKISKIDLVHITSPKNETKSGISVGSNGDFKFKTGSFSYFVALSSTSSDSSSSSGDSSSTGTGLTSPRTGEGSPLPFVLAAVGALGVAGGVVVWRKKKTAQD